MRKEHWRRPAPSAPRFVARPVSGLTSCHVLHGGTVTFPSPKAQWLPLKFQRPTVFSLDHRCGGSVGIARSPRVLTSRLTGLKYNPAPDATHGASGLPRVSSAMLPKSGQRAKLARMQSKVVAILETRTGANLGQLIASRGGIPLLAPALAEEPDLDPEAIRSLLERWRERPMKIVIFQTGVGTRALFQATDELGLTAEILELLAASTVVVRGPKPVGELNARRVRITHRAKSPFTTADVLEVIAGIPLAGEHVLIQQYGAPNRELRAALEALGAEVHEIATYRWALPADRQPLLNLLDALAQARVDAVVFTSAVQVHNLFSVAEPARASALAGQLNRCVVASIGPVCSRALAQFGVKPTFEADPPKLGPLLAGLEAALAAPRRG